MLRGASAWRVCGGGVSGAEGVGEWEEVEEGEEGEDDGGWEWEEVR